MRTSRPRYHGTVISVSDGALYGVRYEDWKGVPRIVTAVPGPRCPWLQVGALVELSVVAGFGVVVEGLAKPKQQRSAKWLDAMKVVHARPRSEKWKAARSRNSRGKPKSDEHKRAIAAGLTRSWQRRKQEAGHE